MPNMAAMSGTSFSSSAGSAPWKTSQLMAAAVVSMTAASTHMVGLVDQTRNPYSSVRLIQMKWNGTVSHWEKTTIATRLATEKAPHATSTHANGHRSAGRPGGQCGAGG